MQWNIQSNQTPRSVEELLEVIFSNRDIQDPEAFLHPIPPTELTLKDVDITEFEMETALSILKDAKEQNRSIVIYGDYDCDGVCATTVLWETLFSLGFKVTPFIPHRERHGYGLSQKGIDELLSQGKPDVLISVDNGIVAHAQWQRLYELGIECILTDHHQPEAQLPRVNSVIHTTKLCGTTVAWMLAREVEREMTGKTESTQRMLDLCAIATIADQVPLLAANRSFAKFGLEELNQTKRLGLQLLIESAGLKPGEMDVYSVNFGIAPRINAMGRLEHALDALRALCTRKEARARELIGALQDTNKVRQELTEDLLSKALAREAEWKEEHIIIIDDTEFHEGIIGLIASKLTETYFKPTIALSVGELTTKGSARSVKGVHITNFLRTLGEDLLEVGGHPMAAGLKIETAKLELVRSKLYALAKETITVEQLVPSLDVECILNPQLMTLNTAQALGELAPFGSGNREPLFLCQEMETLSAKTVGKEGKHLKLTLSHPDLQLPIEAIAFGKGKRLEELEIGEPVSVLAHLSINGWNGRRSVQLMVRDLKTFTQESLSH